MVGKCKGNENTIKNAGIILRYVQNIFILEHILYNFIRCNCPKTKDFTLGTYWYDICVVINDLHNA